MKLTRLFFTALVTLVVACATVPVKQYFMLNYVPSVTAGNATKVPYNSTIRLRDFDIEAAYNRPQIVYRLSPFELDYYTYRIWAIKPARMISDLVYRHLLTQNLVTSITRRLDEGASTPDYELSGVIEAIEEYDSGELWYAHLALRFNLIRLSDGQSMYTRRFDVRKRVFDHKPENVVRELSVLMELVVTQSAQDIDKILAAIYDTSGKASIPIIRLHPDTDSTEEIK